MKTMNFHQNRSQQRSTVSAATASRHSAAATATHLRNMLEEALSC
ncbi:hypothetical protein [Desulfovibrio sp. 86]|nr:hypothetical protein [Desulfovibrio sp. 86]